MSEHKTKPQILSFQPDDAEPIFYTHFDCWTDSGSEDDKQWEWDSAKAVNLVWRLAHQASDEMHGIKKEEVFELTEKYLELGQVEYFERLANMFALAGYCVYNGDTMFEVYNSSDVPMQEDCRVCHEELEHQSNRPDNICQRCASTF